MDLLRAEARAGRIELCFSARAERDDARAVEVMRAISIARPAVVYAAELADGTVAAALAGRVARFARDDDAAAAVLLEGPGSPRATPPASPPVSPLPAMPRSPPGPCGEFCCFGPRILSSSRSA